MRLHVVGDAGDFDGVGESTRQLVRLPDLDAAAGRIRDIHEAQVHAPDVGRVVVERADEREIRHKVRVELLAPLPPEAAVDVTVAGIEVAADADGVPVVQARVATRARPFHQEVAIAVAEDDVRDHLLVRGIPLHRVAWLEPAVRRDELHDGGDAVGADAVPAVRVHHDIARDDVDAFTLRHRVHRARPASGARRPGGARRS
jgi:hypothetical protein